MYVAGCIYMDSAEGMHQDLEKRTFLHGEPVQLLQHRCNVLLPRGPGYDSCDGTLYKLQSSQECI